MRKYRSSIFSEISFYPKEYFSHALILVSVGISLMGFAFPELRFLFGLHRIPLDGDGSIMLAGQVLLYQFLHGDPLHILMNSIFLYQA